MKHQTTRAYIFNQDQNILLVKHTKDSKWVLPWWHLEQPETIYDSIHREIKEEFNIDIELFWEVIGLEDDNIVDYPSPVAVFEINYVHQFHGPQSRLEYVFFADYVWWDLAIQENEIYEYKWFSIDDILSMDIENDTYPHIVLVLEKNLELLGEYDELKDHNH